MNNRRHVLLYTEDPDEGGVAIYNHAMLCGLVNAGYAVTCVQTQVDNPFIRKQAEVGVQHRWLEFHTRVDYQRNNTNLDDAARVFQETRPDIVLFTNCSPFSHIAAKTVAIHMRIPFVVVEGYASPFDEITPPRAWQLYHLGEHYRRAKAVIAVCMENLELLRKQYVLGPGKGEVIHYGRPDEYFAAPSAATRARMRAEASIPEDAVLCLTIGRLAPVKGHKLLIEAMKVWKDSPLWPRLYFAWLGAGGQEGELREQLQQLGVADHVAILGQRWDVVDWLDASDIFILPSLFEGMPLAIMEAMAKGLPVIASAVSGIPEELGSTGCLLPAPTADPRGTVGVMAAKVLEWAEDAQARLLAGSVCKARAEKMFREQRMIDETIQVIERAFVPEKDYISPGLKVVRPDESFPNMGVGDPANCKWPFLRREIPHNWYVDRRVPHTGFLSRDEAHILYNTGLRFKGKRALEIGCWLGWSTCHLALAGVELDVIDPVLSDPRFLESIRSSLVAAGATSPVNLIAGYSPQQVETVAKQSQKKWSLIFVDGNHDAPYPMFDTAVSVEYAEEDALVIFHDLICPDVAVGLDYLRKRGWNTMIYMTAQIMGVGWRGNVEPVRHIPDPSVAWPIPSHLRDYAVSGTASAGHLFAAKA